MPFYEYQCKSCGHALEAMQKVSDAPLRKCPECGKSQLVRLMSAPVFRLKGGGWYETDFKGDNEKQRNLADRPDADAAKAEKGDAKADAKGAEDGKSGDAKGGDAKGVEAKGGDSKGGDAKGGDSKADAGVKDPKGSTIGASARHKPGDKSAKASAGGASRGRRASLKPAAKRSAKQPAKAKRPR
jgi:putative FmdB family regulatory protein